MTVQAKLCSSLKQPRVSIIRVENCATKTLPTGISYVSTSISFIYLITTHVIGWVAISSVNNSSVPVVIFSDNLTDWIDDYQIPSYY